MRIKTGAPIEPSLFGFRSDGVFQPVTAIATDSREIRPGDLFVALRGEKVDGTAYIGEAFSRGAAHVLSHETSVDRRVLTVSDPIAVLSDAAKRYARTIPHRTVGITGSYGKTTLRHHLTEVLSSALPVAYTEDSRNTDLSLALTLLSMKRDARILIAELGMRGRGEIARLSRLICPDVAAITAIGSAHVGLLGSVDSIREAKCEIIDGLAPDGLLLFPANDPALSKRIETLPVRSASVSTDPAVRCDYLLKTVGVENGRATVSLSSHNGKIGRVTLPGCDAALLSSAAFCFSVCEALGVSREITLSGLSRLSPPPLRGQTETVGGVNLMLDCYNASPEPTLSALDSLSRYQAEGKRLFLLLGEMLELGETAPEYHRAVGRKVAALSPEYLFCVGELAAYYAEGAVDAGFPRARIGLYARDELPRLADEIKNRTKPGDLLFIKGSRALALESVVPLLKQAET